VGNREWRITNANSTTHNTNSIHTSRSVDRINARAEILQFYDFIIIPRFTLTFKIRGIIKAISPIFLVSSRSHDWWCLKTRRKYIRVTLTRCQRKFPEGTEEECWDRKPKLSKAIAKLRKNSRKRSNPLTRYADARHVLSNSLCGAQRIQPDAGTSAHRCSEVRRDVKKFRDLQKKKQEEEEGLAQPLSHRSVVPHQDRTFGANVVRVGTSAASTRFFPRCERNQCYKRWETFWRSRISFLLGLYVSSLLSLFFLFFFRFSTFYLTSVSRACIYKVSVSRLASVNRSITRIGRYILTNAHQEIFSFDFPFFLSFFFPKVTFTSSEREVTSSDRRDSYAHDVHQLIPRGRADSIPRFDGGAVLDLGYIMQKLLMQKA